MGVSKNNGKPPNHPILIGFSMKKTLHFGVFSSYFWKHPIEEKLSYGWMSQIFFGSMVRINGFSLPTYKWDILGLIETRLTWRIGPHDVTDTWLITMVIVSPLIPGVVGPLPNGRFMAYKWG